MSRFKPIEGFPNIVIGHCTNSSRLQGCQLRGEFGEIEIHGRNITVLPYGGGPGFGFDGLQKNEKEEGKLLIYGGDQEKLAAEVAKNRQHYPLAGAVVKIELRTGGYNLVWSGSMYGPSLQSISGTPEQIAQGVTCSFIRK